MWRNHAYAFYLDSITNGNGNTKFSLAWTVTKTYSMFIDVQASETIPHAEVYACHKIFLNGQYVWCDQKSSRPKTTKLTTKFEIWCTVIGI